MSEMFVCLALSPAWCMCAQTCACLHVCMHAQGSGSNMGSCWAVFCFCCWAALCPGHRATCDSVWLCMLHHNACVLAAIAAAARNC